MDEEAKAIGERLQKARTDCALKKKEVRRPSAARRKTSRRLEAARKPASIFDLKKLVHLYGTTYEKLMGGGHTET